MDVQGRVLERGAAPLLWWWGVAVAAFLLAALAVLPPSPAISLALAGVAVGAWGLYRYPVGGVAALLLFFPFYMWLDAVLFALLSPAVETMVSIGKEVVLAGLLGVALVRRGHRGRLAPAGTWWVLTAFVLLVGLLTLAPAAPIGASVLEARFHLEYLFLLPIALLIAERERDRRAVLYAVLVAAVGVAAAWLSVLGWVGLGALRYAQATTGVLMGGGRFDAINALGAHLALVLLVIGGLLLQTSRGRNRMVLLLVAGLLTWALLSTFSRRAVLGVAAGLTTIAIVARQWRLLGWSAVGALLVLVVASPAMLQRFSIEQADATSGVSIRLQHLVHVLEHLDAVSLFIGHGVGTAGVVALVAGVENAVDLHNYYLLLIYETGLAGLGLYLTLCGLCFRGLRDRYRSASLPLDRGLTLGAIGGLAGFLVMGLFGAINATIPVAPIMWALIGAALAVPGAPPRPERHDVAVGAAAWGRVAPGGRS